MIFNSLSFLFAVSMAPSGTTDTLTIDQVHAALADVIHVMVVPNGADTIRGVLLAQRAPAASPLASLIADQGYLLTYLVDHGPSFRQDTLLAGTADAATAAQRLREALRKDAQFNAVFLPLAARALAEHGTVLRGVSARGIARPRVSLVALQRLAARFFFPDAITPTGTITGHICVGINGLQDFEDGRDLMREAFVYNAIMREITQPDSKMGPVFRRAMDAATALGLSTDPRLKLARAQGIVWHVMAVDPDLHAVLAAAYTAARPVLPFVAG